MRIPITLAIAISVVPLTQRGEAATVYWDGVDGAIWENPANWSTHPTANTPNPGVPPGAGDVVVLNRHPAFEVRLMGDQAVMGVEVLPSPTQSGVVAAIRSAGSDTRTLSIGASGITMAGLAIEIGYPDASRDLNVLLMADQTWAYNGVLAAGTVFAVDNQVSLGVPGSHTLTLAGTSGGQALCVIYGTIADGAGVLSLQVAAVPDRSWDLHGVNTYTGATNVSSGMLTVEGTLANTSAVAVGSGGTLGGNGIIHSLASTTVHGTLNAGSDIMPMATLTMGPLSLESGAAFVLDISTKYLWNDRIVVNGDLSLESEVMLVLRDFFGTTTPLQLGTTFTFIDYSGSWDGGLFRVGADVIADDVGRFTVGKNTYAINYNGGVDGSDMQLVVVPEPGSAVTLLSGLGVILARRRRQASWTVMENGLEGNLRRDPERVAVLEG